MQLSAPLIFYIFFFFSQPLLLFSSRSSLLPSLHLRQHLPPLKCPAGQTDAGPDQSEKVIWDASCACTHAHTHTRAQAVQIVSDAHRSFVTLWPDCLHSHRSASTLPNGFFSSILLHFFFPLLDVTQNIKCCRPCARCVHKQFFF